MENQIIMRNDVNSVTFCTSMEEAYNKAGENSISWNIDDRNEGNIMAYAKAINVGDTVIYDVYIGSKGKINANANSSYLFSNIGKNENCTDTSLVKGMENVNWSQATNMQGMFYSAGQTAMISLDLGTSFDTSNVVNMNSMFDFCGVNNMESINLGDEFDTSKVTDMTNMFRSCRKI